ncbi:histidine kinase [uncultured Ferrimonas sp.]|uniref:sensor histidine kinase n=1 Tax=uncultured Ferrimonas sp. TaxID=432640 RepID=UPI00260D9953|nr:histidine kinase [uncultured Ferrimonas sp.]
MMLIFFCHFILTWSVLHSLVDVPEQYSEPLIVRSLLEATLLLSICHMLVRPYLRANMLTLSITSQLIAKSIIYLMVISLIYFLLSYSLGKLDSLAVTDITQIQVESQSGSVKGQMTLWTLIILGTGESFITLMTWSVIYLAFKYQKNKKTLQAEVTSSQIQQLTNQLSPHFLFNTLNSIRALIYADQDKAAEVITLLSDLLRKQMHSQLEMKSILKDDWSITENYLSIESVRFEDRLTLNCDFEPGTLTQTMPTLTLLTLAENAIKHGISPSSKAGYLSISSNQLTADRWCLEVKNSVFNAVDTPGTRIGIHNIKKRLELMFGSDFCFSSQLMDEYFLVRIELPYVKSLNR